MWQIGFSARDEEHEPEPETMEANESRGEGRGVGEEAVNAEEQRSIAIS